MHIILVSVETLKHLNALLFSLSNFPVFLGI